MTTDNTATGTDATADAGQSGTVSGTPNQDPGLETRLSDYATQLARFAEERDSWDKKANAAQAEARRWESSYRRLQSSTTASLQEAARTRRELDGQQRIHDELAQARAEMVQVREGIAFLASRMGDEDSAKEFQLRQREIQIQMAESAAKQRLADLQAAANQPQATTSTQYVNPDDQKRDFLEYYFPGTGIDYNDPSIDWGANAPNTQEAFRRFTTSVMKLTGTKDQPQAQTTSELDQALASIRQEQEALRTANAKALVDLQETNRKDVEDRLRKLGADSGNGRTSSPSAANAATRLNELDESKLMTGDPTSNKAAARAMEAELRILRNQLLGNQ